MKNLNITFLIILFTMTLTGCLKTRAQLRDESTEDKTLTPYKAVSASPPQEIPSQYALDEIKVAFTQLEGRLQELERAHQDDKGSPSAKKLESRVQVIEQSLAGLSQSQSKIDQTQTEIQQTQEVLSNALKEIQENPVLINPDEAFKRAKAQFDAGDFASAVDSFAAYLKIPKATKIEDAIYMRATSLFRLKQYKKAIVDFSKFPEKFPKSPKTPDALYKIALSFEALDMKDDARGFYQELVEKYPKSPEAKKAKKKAK